jgi:hypothetical protein
MSKSPLVTGLLTTLALVALPIAAWGAAAPAEKGDDYYTKKVCEVIKPTGSRLGGTRRCRTQAEIDAARAEQRQVIERVQSMKVTLCPPNC